MHVKLTNTPLTPGPPPGLDPDLVHHDAATVPGTPGAVPDLTLLGAPIVGVTVTARCRPGGAISVIG